MNLYQQEQLETTQKVSSHLLTLPKFQKQVMMDMISDYIEFRRNVHQFLSDHFHTVCTEKCYQDNLSACCSKDGIITFFADIVINLLLSSESEIERLISYLQKPHVGLKCLYLDKTGCLWKMKPIVCEMFLCDHAEQQVFKNQPAIKQTWDLLKAQEKRFTWPDQPVLFEKIEDMYLEKNISSPLMYFHFSPGLLKIKNKRKM